MIRLKSLILENVVTHPDGKLQISSPDLITSEQWNKVAKFMHQKGYNIRNGEDAKQFVTKYLDKGGGVLTPDGEFMSDWLSSIKLALGISEKTPMRNNKDARRVFSAAKRKFGVTTNIKLSGYVLPDGSLLNLSHSGHSRDLDHREIANVFHKLGIDLSPNDNSTTPYMQAFMEMGAIRINGEYGNVDVGAPPTEAQRKILGMIFSLNNGEIALDVHDKRFGSDGRTYKEGTSPTRILRDIETFYRHGSFPRQSEFVENILLSSETSENSDEWDDWVQYIKDVDSFIEKAEISKLIKRHGLSYEIFLNNSIVKIYDKGRSVYLEFDKENDTFDNIGDIVEWAYGLYNKDLTKYGIYPEKIYNGWVESSLEDLSKEPGIVYHYTNEENFESIKTSGGLTRTGGTGINNRSAYGLFTTTNREEYATGTYGEVCLEINLDEFLKNSGLKQLELAFEPEIEEYLVMEYIKGTLSLNIHVDMPSDISPYTVIVNHDIPIQFVKQI